MRRPASDARRRSRLSRARGCEPLKLDPPSLPSSRARAGEKLVLSEQALVDCAWPEGNNGCDGGMDDGAYRWAAAHGGLPTAAAYGPYLNADGACHARAVAAAHKVEVAGFSRVRPAAADVRDALARKGPLSVALYAKAQARATATGVGRG